MRPMRILGVSTLAAGVGIAGLLGVGLGTAGAGSGTAMRGAECARLRAWAARAEPSRGPASRGPARGGKQGQWQQGPGAGRPDGNDWQRNNDWQGGNNWQRDNDWQRGPDSWSRPLTTGSSAVSTKAARITSRSCGAANGWTRCPPVTVPAGASGSSASGSRCKG